MKIDLTNQTIARAACLYQRPGFRPIATGLLTSRSNTGEKIRSIILECDHFLTFFLPIYFVQGNKLSAYILVHRIYRVVARAKPVWPVWVILTAHSITCPGITGPRPGHIGGRE